MKTKLSVILPGIRMHNWKKFYQSVSNSFNDTFELIIVSPFELPEELKQFDNIKHIVDRGSPARCQQIGLANSEGEFVTWGADDGLFLKKKLTEIFNFWQKNAKSEKDIVTCKYFEGATNQQGILHSTGKTELSEDFYYKINHANGLRSAFVPDDYWVLNVGLIKTSYAKELGGWDTMFEVTTVSHMDFAVRTQRNNSTYFMFEKPVFACTHMPGVSGDHAPVHFAHTEHDEPLFRKIYNQPNSVDRVKIDINNWKNSPDVWKRRF
tara:strand:- start:378 stop:1175 length:798 start_codon:yes stop_codon:yes gene_type:complete